MKSLFSSKPTATVHTPQSYPCHLIQPSWQNPPSDQRGATYSVYNPKQEQDEKEEKENGTKKRPRTPTKQDQLLADETSRYLQAYQHINPHHSILQTYQNLEVCVMADVSYPREIIYGILTYFEVTCHRVDASAAVAVGLTAEPFPDTKFLPGWKKNSWGFHSDDGMKHCDGEGAPFSTPWGASGDVIGCGITHAGDIFYTKNGTLLGLAFTRIYPRRALTPIVGMDKPGIISINFGRAPFRFSLNTLITTLTTPSPRPPQRTGIIQRILLTQPSITTRIMSMISTSSRDLHEFSQVCDAWYQLLSTPSHSNNVWQHIARVKWPHIPSETMKMASWRIFVRERTKALKAHRSEIPIENCALSFPIQIPDTLEWKFQCPVAFESLTRTADPTIDHCSVCNKDVYLSRTEAELITNVEMGRCVAFDVRGAIITARTPHRHIKRGKMVARPAIFAAEK